MGIFQKRFTELRKERGLSQEQMAAALGCSRSRVGMYETGRREPDFEMLEAIADFFNVDKNYLLGESDASVRADADMDLILKVMRDDSLRCRLLEYAKLLTNQKEEN